MLLQGIGAQQWPHQSVRDKAQRSSLSFRFVHGTVTGAAVVSFTVKLSRTVVHGWYHCTLFCSFSYTKLQNMSLGEWDSGGSTAGAVMVLKVHRSLVLRFWPAGHVPSKQWQPAFLLFFFFFFFFLRTSATLSVFVFGQHGFWTHLCNFSCSPSTPWTIVSQRLATLRWVTRDFFFFFWGRVHGHGNNQLLINCSDITRTTTTYPDYVQ